MILFVDAFPHAQPAVCLRVPVERRLHVGTWKLCTVKTVPSSLKGKRNQDAGLFSVFQQQISDLAVVL
jgi:hypothetical protein